MSGGHTPESRARHAAANTSKKGRQGKVKSPWSKGPMAGTYSAGLSYLRYRKIEPTNGK